MNQVLPYIPYAKEDSDLRYLLEGLINRQAKSILLDPFANAFNFNSSGEGHQQDRRTPPMTSAVFEGKYEIDSLCAFLKLSYWYVRTMGPELGKIIINKTWLDAVGVALDTIDLMRNDDGREQSESYLFQRVTSAALDTLSLYGRGPPANHESGLSRSLFRPSDDAVTFAYNIPGNAMACVEIAHIANILPTLSLDDLESVKADVANKASLLSSSLCSAVKKYTVNSADVIPYEVDGFRSMYFMDDANLPSLLSLPFAGFMSAKNELYQQTRSFVLSTSNPFYFKGSETDGVGGPHVGLNYTWPMSIIMRAMTSVNSQEIKNCLDTLLTSTAGTGLMHESFNVNDSNDFTRSWFAWANGLFGELVLQLIHTHPDLVLKNDPAIIEFAQSLVKPPISLISQHETIF